MHAHTDLYVIPNRLRDGQFVLSYSLRPDSLPADNDISVRGSFLRDDETCHSFVLYKLLLGTVNGNFMYIL